MKDKKRVNEAICYGMIYTLVIMLLGFAGFQLFAQPLIGLFSVSLETLQLCLKAVRIISFGFLFAGANIAFQGIFQALGGGVRSLIVSLLRQIVFVLPLAYVFSWMPGADNLIWFAFPLAEGGALIMALILMKHLTATELKNRAMLAVD